MTACIIVALGAAVVAAAFFLGRAAIYAARRWYFLATMTPDQRNDLAVFQSSLGVMWYRLDLYPFIRRERVRHLMFVLFMSRTKLGAVDAYCLAVRACGLAQAQLALTGRSVFQS